MLGGLRLALDNASLKISNNYRDLPIFVIPIIIYLRFSIFSFKCSKFHHVHSCSVMTYGIYKILYFGIFTGSNTCLMAQWARDVIQFMSCLTFGRLLSAYYVYIYIKHGPLYSVSIIFINNIRI